MSVVSRRSGRDDSSTVKSRLVERGFQVVFELAERPEGARLVQLSRAVALSRATTLRILRTLRELSVVDLDERRRLYYLGPAAIRLGAAAAEQSNIARVAQPFLEHLQRVTGETVALYRVQADVRTCVAAVQSRHEIRHTIQVGVSRPVLRGAAGKVIAASMTDDDLRPLLRRLPAAERRALELAARRARARGWAMTRDEIVRGGTAIAAPVRGPDGRLAGVVTVLGPSTRITREVAATIVEHLLGATRRIEARLAGFPADPPDRPRR